jgi:tetratricopeptide (TPR) repeat protein
LEEVEALMDQSKYTHSLPVDQGYFDPLLKELNARAEHTPEYLNTLGFVLSQKFKFSGQLADIERAIQVLEEATYLSAPTSSQWQQSVHNLGTALMEHYQHSQKPEHLDRAIHLYEQLAEHKASDKAEQPDHLLNLCTCLMFRFDRTKNIADLDRLIRIGQEITEHTSGRSSHRQVHSNNHTTALLLRYTLTDKSDDQKAAIQTMALLLSEMAGDDPDRLPWIDKLGRIMLTYINQTTDPAALTEMIQIGRQLADTTPPDADYLPMVLTLVASGYTGRFTQTDDKNDLQQVLKLQERALSLCQAGSFYQMQCLYNLGTTLLHMRYTLTHNQDDVERAVKLLEQAVALLPADFHLRPVYISTLADALQARFERTENLADLERARDLRAKL